MSPLYNIGDNYVWWLGLSPYAGGPAVIPMSKARGPQPGVMLEGRGLARPAADDSTPAARGRREGIGAPGQACGRGGRHPQRANQLWNCIKSIAAEAGVTLILPPMKAVTGFSSLRRIFSQSSESTAIVAFGLSAGPSLYCSVPLLTVRFQMPASRPE